MTTGTTSLLSLALPVEGELDGTWGDVVNNGITDYVDISIAGTLTLNGDGAVTLAKTAGDSVGTNIGSTTAQYAIIKITGTLTTTKIITAPSTSKTYIVDNAATGGVVTFKAAGQTGVSVAVAEKCTVYYNGTDYVKVASSTTDGVSTISFGSTGLTPSTATSGAVTVAGTLAIANGGTGTTSTTFANLTTNVTGTLPVANGGTGAASFTANNVLLGNGTSALQVVAPSTAGNVLTSNGTTWVSSAAVTGLPSQTGNAGKYLTTDGTNPSWTATGAAAGGSIYINTEVISQNYTFPIGSNGMSVGPITIQSGYSVTVAGSQRWVIL